MAQLCGFNLLQRLLSFATFSDQRDRLCQFFVSISCRDFLVLRQFRLKRQRRSEDAVSISCRDFLVLRLNTIEPMSLRQSWSFNLLQRLLSFATLFKVFNSRRPLIVSISCRDFLVLRQTVVYEYKVEFKGVSISCRDFLVLRLRFPLPYTPDFGSFNLLQRLLSFATGCESAQSALVRAVSISCRDFLVLRPLQNSPVMETRRISFNLLQRLLSFATFFSFVIERFSGKCFNLLQRLLSFATYTATRRATRNSSFQSLAETS